MDFVKYHKIGQFKEVVKSVQNKANFKGLDEEGNPIYEDSLKPTITFKGTIKLHGTNAGICYSPEEGLFAQKRSSLLQKDHLQAHFGFNEYVQVTQKDNILQLVNSLYSQYCKEGEQIILYGEWAGQGIQKGVSISELPKSFYLFDCKVYNKNEDSHKWLDVSSFDKIDIPNFYNIFDFINLKMDIDFNQPQYHQNDLINYTNDVEKLCPVAAMFKSLGTGEGIVWTGFLDDQKLIFKVKGEKHSVSKVKTLASVDPEVLKNVEAFVEYACTPNRIEQGIQETSSETKKDTPKLLKWVANDIISEEQLELKSNNLEWKQVAKDCNNRVKEYFFNKIDKF